MKQLHPSSFVLGLFSGIIVLLVISTGMRVLHPATPTLATGNTGYQGFGGNGAPNTARMAQRMGITEAELQKELDSGKTMQQIATEHGVQFGGGRRGGSGATLPASGTGARASAAAISSSSSVAR